MGQICYFCTTPFQLMTVINLQMTLNHDNVADLFIIDQFLGADEVVMKTAQISLFRNVTLVCEDDVYTTGTKTKLKISLEEFWAYINLDKLMQKVLKENYYTSYDAIYISNRTFIIRLATIYYTRKYDSEIIYYEDGVGSYINKELFHPPLVDRLVRKVLFGNFEKVIHPKKILVYSPELFSSYGVNDLTDIIVEAIPKWKSNVNFIRYTNYIFSYSSEEVLREPIIIFDSFFEQEERDRLDRFYKKISQMAGKENVIVKKHPRDKETGCYGLKYYKYPGVPFELICQNTKMDKKLLIAVNTTAVVTPVLLFNEEPYVLIINDIPGLTNNHSNAHYDKFKDMYADKEKFYEAKSIEDAEKFIDNFCSQ